MRGNRQCRTCSHRFHIGSLLRRKHEAVRKLLFLHAQVLAFLRFCFVCVPKGLSACSKACSRLCFQSCYPCSVTRAAVEYSICARQSMFSAATYSGCMDCSFTMQSTMHYTMHYTLHCTRHCTTHCTTHSTAHSTACIAPWVMRCSIHCINLWWGWPCVLCRSALQLGSWLHPLWSVSCTARFECQFGGGNVLEVFLLHPAGELLAMFKACMPVIRCDIQSARFLMPYLLQCVISTGSSDSCKGDSTLTAIPLFALIGCVSCLPCSGSIYTWSHLLRKEPIHQ